MTSQDWNDSQHIFVFEMNQLSNANNHGIVFVTTFLWIENPINVVFNILKTGITNGAESKYV